VEAVASHQGWIQARALGGRSVASQSLDLVTSSAYVNNGWNTPSVTLGWNPMIIPNATVTSYTVYRSNFSGAENYTSPLATGISASTNSFTDTSVSASTDYYYVVRPVSGTTEFQTTDSDTEIKIMVPPVNMSLVHRWIANWEMCSNLMGRNYDRNNNYRCEYAGPGNNNGYYDVGQNSFWDTVKHGMQITHFLFKFS
jgi:hypothetical protein